MFLSDSKQRARIDQRKPSKQVSVGYGGTRGPYPACLLVLTCQPFLPRSPLLARPGTQMVLQLGRSKVCPAVIWFMLILDPSISELAGGWILSSGEYEVLNASEVTCAERRTGNGEER